MLIIGLYRAHKHRGRYINHRSKTGKPYHVYFIDELTSRFGSFYADAVSALAYKLQNCKRKTFLFLACGSKNLMYYRNNEDLKDTPCPGCGARQKISKRRLMTR